MQLDQISYTNFGNSKEYIVYIDLDHDKHDEEVKSVKQLFKDLNISDYVIKGVENSCELCPRDGEKEQTIWYYLSARVETDDNVLVNQLIDKLN